MARAESKLPADALSAGLGDDLAALLADLPVSVVSATPVTSLSARRSNRASFRIALADGAQLKARRFESAFEAARFTRLTQHLSDPAVPAAIAQRGATVLEPWIEGHVLTSADVAPEELRTCGALLGAIHVARLPPGSDADIAVARRERERRLADNLQRLQAAGKIDEAFIRRVRAAAAPVPSAPAIGLIHGDFCPENLLRTAAGPIVAVDNETMRFESLDYDLARSWYRWPMSDGQARSFMDGYATRRSADSFLRHFAYWAICALVDSAVFRCDAGITGVDAVLTRLDTFAREKPSFPGP
jgi:aminoglycoside phosphotransferase (APT) family kinase protein